jgi:hypothetical protein
VNADRNPAARPSLFVVALARSLSSVIYHAVRRALELREPEWTTDGEVLNVRRFALLAEEGDVEGIKYVERRRDARRFDRLLGFLGQVARADGFAYKDVIQPFLVAEWLPASGLPVLHLDRPVPDVAYAMLQRGWHYPAEAAAAKGVAPPAAPSCAATSEAPTPVARDAEDLQRALVSGLLRARQALAAVPAARVLYDDLIHDEAPLHDALRSLYGGDPPRPAYLDDAFRRDRDEVLKRRQTDLHRHLSALCREIEDGR